MNVTSVFFGAGSYHRQSVMCIVKARKFLKVFFGIKMTKEI